jgi:hypothetical protein
MLESVLENSDHSFSRTPTTASRELERQPGALERRSNNISFSGIIGLSLQSSDRDLTGSMRI